MDKREKIAEIIRGDLGMPNERLALERADKILALLPRGTRDRERIKEAYAIAFASPELNMENYIKEDASKLNDAMCEVCCILEPPPQPPKEKLNG